MKKTIVAAAIAAVVAAPAAMAEISISGKVLAEVNQDGAFSANDSTLKIAGSEDLGNGLKASFVYEGKLAMDGNTSGNAAWTNGGKNSYVALGNDTMTVAAGFLYGPTKGLYGFSKTAIGEDVATDNSKFLLEGTEASANGIAVSANAAGIKLTVAATEGTNGEVGDNMHYAAQGSFGAVNVGVAYQDLASMTDETLTVAANTTFGDTTVGFIYQDNDTLGNAHIVAVTHKMGANTIAVSMGDTDDSSTTGATANDGWGVKLTHALSKNTNVFVAYQDEEAAADQASTIGLMHKF